jgi:TRAP transporter TAXI family solute receptor
MMLSLFPESLTVIVRSNSAINSFEDIKGKRVVMGNNGSGSKKLTAKLFAFYGWKTEDFVSLESVDISTHSQALCDNKIDVMITNQGHPNSTIKEATTTCDVNILPVFGEKINEFLSSSPYYQVSTIPGGIYAGNPNDITTFGSKALLVTTDNIDHITIYNITKSILNSFNNFKALNPVFASSEISAMIDGVNVDYLHEGAAKYLNETNLLAK